MSASFLKESKKKERMLVTFLKQIPPHTPPTYLQRSQKRTLVTFLKQIPPQTPPT